jgi:hypothetical protein
MEMVASWQNTKEKVESLDPAQEHALLLTDVPIYVCTYNFLYARNVFPNAVAGT